MFSIFSWLFGGIKEFLDPESDTCPIRGVKILLVVIGCGGSSSGSISNVPSNSNFRIFSSTANLSGA